MNGWDEFNEQFRETEYEKRERWAATRRKRTAEGKCWQCAKLIADCTCPNVTHAALAKEDERCAILKSGMNVLGGGA